MAKRGQLTHHLAALGAAETRSDKGTRQVLCCISIVTAEPRTRSEEMRSIAGVVHRIARAAPAPVHLWDPPYCGDLNLRIASDGTWYYLNSPIGRQALVRLFASVLKREGNKYFLVTPVEKCGIIVDDAPFLAVELDLLRNAQGAQVLHFRTNVDDQVACGRDHPLRFETQVATGGLKPYLHVRRNLWALLARPLLYQLVSLGEKREIDGKRRFGVASGGEFFAMTDSELLQDLIS